MREQLDKLIDLYNDLKQEIRQKDRHLFERWKAGGFLVDDDILSMYPNLTQVVDQLEGDDDDEDANP